MHPDFAGLCSDFADFDLCGDYKFPVPMRIDSDFADVMLRLCRPMFILRFRLCRLCSDFADYDQICQNYFQTLQTYVQTMKTLTCVVTMNFRSPLGSNQTLQTLCSDFADLCSDFADFADLCSDLADLCSDFADLCIDFADFDLRGDYEF